MAGVPNIENLMNEINDNKMIEQILIDLEQMEHSRDYWKSKALQYKVDLIGAQKGIKRLKLRLAKTKQAQDILMLARENRLQIEPNDNIITKS